MRTAAIRIVARASCLALIVGARADARAGGHAAEPAHEPPLVKVIGKCPASGVLTTALAPALGKAAASAPHAPPRVRDLGDRFEVAVAGQVNLYPDAKRDCDERARVAAVFIALALTPPMIQLRAAPEAPPFPAPQPIKEAPVERWTTVSVAARCDEAFSGASPSMAGIACGGELGASMGRAGHAAFLSAAVLAPTMNTFTSVAVRVQRFPLAIGATIARELPAGWRIGADAGVAMAVLRIRGEGLDVGQPALRFDAGARIGAALLLPVVGSGWSPAIGLHAEYFPRAYQLDVDPLGTIGSLSRLWVGVSVGFSYRSGRGRADGSSLVTAVMPPVERP